MKDNPAKGVERFVLVLVVLFIIIIIRSYYNKKSSRSDDFFNSGKYETLMMIDSYDSISVNEIIIKYPKSYNINNEYGSDELGGFTLEKGYASVAREKSINRIIYIDYSIKRLEKESSITFYSIEKSLKNAKERIINNLITEDKEKPIVDEVEIKYVGGRKIHIQKLKYNNFDVSIYAIEIENMIISFTSTKEALLSSIIQKINKDNNQQKEVSNLVKTDSLKTKIREINKLKIPIHDWEIIEDVDVKEVNMKQITLKNDESIFSVSVAPHNYINGIKEYSDYNNEIIVRNLKPNGVILTSKGLKRGKFKNQESITELFSAYHTPTESNFEMESITFKIGEYFYSLFYAKNYKSDNLIENIKIDN